MTALAWMATPVCAGSGFAERVVPGSAGVLIPGLSACACSLGPATRLSLRSPGPATDLSPAAANEFWDRLRRCSFFSWPLGNILAGPGRLVCGPRRRWRGHLTAGKGTTDLQAATQAAGSPGPHIREKP